MGFGSFLHDAVDEAASSSASKPGFASSNSSGGILARRAGTTGCGGCWGGGGLGLGLGAGLCGCQRTLGLCSRFAVGATMLCGPECPAGRQQRKRPPSFSSASWQVLTPGGAGWPGREPAAALAASSTSCLAACFACLDALLTFWPVT